MKKKTALTLSAIALLGAGVTFGGTKLKQKKDFEKTLKTVLIPNAEQQLDSLFREDASLQDSVLKYEQALKVIENQQKQISNKPTVSVQGPLREIYDLLERLAGERDHELYVIHYKKLGNEAHETATNWDIPEYEKTTDKKINELYKRLYYLTGNKDYADPHVPIKNGKFVLKKPVQVPEHVYNGVFVSGEEFTEREVSCLVRGEWIQETVLIDNYEEYEGYERIRTYEELESKEYDIYEDITTYKNTEDLSVFFTTLHDAILSTSESVWSSFCYNNCNTLALRNTHPGLKLAILKSIQSFVESVDNSENAFDAKTLKTLDTKVKELLPIVEQEYSLVQQKNNLEDLHYETSSKVKKFKSSKEKLDGSIKKQKEKINHLKQTNITQLMKEQLNK